ncbi:MAG TPA: chitobiase/beta-hexosaminidase C-terminal domain-containing protein, partial [Cellvibrio sp.]|nr:chitobiase/beta-hexosaminidase C-terminal domain-containing protein [Cellvibrio sp.]
MSQPRIYAQTTVNYQYDALGRLVTVEDTQNGNRGYVYDAAGNRTNVNVAPVPAVVVPAISPNGGTFTSAQSVSLTSATSGASIYYTTNGVEPTTSSTLYNNTPFTVSST